MKLPKLNIDQEAIKAFFKTDRGVLLISLGISFFFWLLIKLSNEYPAQREINVEYNLPENMSFVKIPPKTMKITLFGRGWDLMYDYFSGSTSTIALDLDKTPIQGISNTQLNSKITKGETSSGLKVTYMEPGFIPIELGKSAIKRVPIVLESDLTFAPEHHLKSSITIQPDSITLAGPEPLLMEYDEWKTSLLSLKNLQTSVERPLTLQPTNKEQLQLSEKIVQVNIPVEQFTEKSMFLPIQVKNSSDSLKMFPDKVKVSFVVGLSQYDSIAQQHFQLEVDLKGIAINEEKNTAPIILTKHPKKVENIRFSPNSVSFSFILVQDSISSTENALPIEK